MMEWDYIHCDGSEMRRKLDLLLINGDYISDYARSLPPLVVKLEGIHIKKKSQAKPLGKVMLMKKLHNSICNYITLI